MLDVFRHAGFPVTSGIEYGTVTLRFPIEPTDAYRSALAAREETRRLPPGGQVVTPLVVAGPAGISEHDGGPYHPEQQSRLFAVMDGVRALGLEDEVVYPAIREASRRRAVPGALGRHTWPSSRRSAPGGGDIDPDTYARPDSWTAARRAAGAGLVALAELDRRGEGIAFVPVRPPGHHATPDRAMGFCLVNNVAVAAASRTAAASGS